MSISMLGHLKQHQVILVKKAKKVKKAPSRSNCKWLGKAGKFLVNKIDWSLLVLCCSIKGLIAKGLLLQYNQIRGGISHITVSQY